MPASLSGPSHPPAAGGSPRQLVVLLHGYGADGNDLIGLAPFFARALPNAEFISPNAPFPCDMGFGYQWFPITDFDPVAMLKGVRAAAPFLDAFIDEALKARNLTPRQLGLIGFSQGTMMALDRAMRRPNSAAAIVGFSGMATGPVSSLPPDAARAPILLVHGEADGVIPFAKLDETAAILTGNGFEVETMARPGLAHGIDGEGAGRAAEFLAEHLAAGPIS